MLQDFGIVVIQLMHKRKRTGDGSIKFPDLQCWNPETRVVTFIAEIDGERIDCKISLSDLIKKNPTSSNDPLESINSSKEELETIAKYKIEQKLFDKDGSINISYKDLR